MELVWLTDYQLLAASASFTENAAEDGQGICTSPPNFKDQISLLIQPGPDMVLGNIWDRTSR